MEKKILEVVGGVNIDSVLDVTSIELVVEAAINNYHLFVQTGL